MVLDRGRDRLQRARVRAPTSRCSAAMLGGTRDDLVHRRLDLRASYQITMAGLAATRIFSAAGAGGIVLTYWALRKAGMPRRRAACRMVAFLVLTYFVYLAALVVFGVLLRTRVLPGDAPLGRHRRARGHRGRDHPAVPADRADPAGLRAAHPALRRRLPAHALPASASPRARPRSPPACAPRSPTSATRSAALLAVGGAVGFWAANIGVLWASFEAFGGHVPFARARAGLLRRHGREPDPVAGRAAWAPSTRA